MAVPRFVIYQDSAGGYRWRLVDGDNEKVAASEAYTSATSARRGAENVKATAPVAVIDS